MNRHTFSFATVSASFALAAGMWLTPASAKSACAPYEIVVQRLAETYGEAPSLRGTTKSNYTIEVFSSQDFDTWTVTVRADGGQTCLTASGKGRADLDIVLAVES
ncbi:MAG: hypothetical protein ABNH38_16145 [Tateyamaria sp.]|jgi:hypothetical protein|uniref:hypothetical protein n=1 Tax=Tateyamaria sp. TaxID=1929288 RepID=UPI0032DD8917